MTDTGVARAAARGRDQGPQFMNKPGRA